MNPPRIPDHELLRQIDQGGYGQVWLARNVLGSFRAVKIVDRDSFGSDRPYEREFKGLQQFEPVSRTHPGLVNLLHVGRDLEAGYFYCVMEIADDRVTGQAIQPKTYRPRTLASEINTRGHLPLNESLELGIALAGALGHLHSKGLVHRDVKPSNVIFVNGAPKLADIGLVTQIGNKATFVGTEGYLAPEGPGTPEADLFSLGKVLYEASIGKSQDDFPELPTALREWPDAAGLMRLNDIVLKLCESRPAKRFRSAAELSAELLKLREESISKQNRAAETGGGGKFAGLKAVILSSLSDERIAKLTNSLSENLRTAGSVVFTNHESGLNVEWARRIEHHIRQAQVVITVWGGSKVVDEMLSYALEVAHQASRRTSGVPRLISVSYQSNGPLPRQISLALEGAASIKIEQPTAFDAIIAQVLAKI
jgi:serine/threonine protein kinase